MAVQTATDKSGLVWKLYKTEVVSKDPVTVRKMILMPGASGHGGYFSYFNHGELITSGYPNTGSLTFAAGSDDADDNHLITDAGSTGIFHNAAVGDVVHIDQSSTGNSKGYFVIVSRTDENVVEVADVAGEITNETATACRIWVYKGHPFARMYPASTEIVELDFGDEGYSLPSLVCNTSSHASNYWYIYTI
jgi:hypothetical protein